MLYDVFDCFPTLHSSHTRLRSANRKTRPSSQIRISDSETPNSLRSISESSGIADQDLVSSSANRKPSCTSSDISLVNQNLSKVEAVDEPPPVVVIDSTTLGATKSTCSAVSEIVQKDNLIGDHKTKFDSVNQKPSVLAKSDISLIDQIQKIKKVVAVSSSETSTSEIKATSTISSTSSSTNQKLSLKSSHSPLANNNTVVVEQHHQNNKIEEISTTESTVDTMLAKSDSGFSEKANTEEEEGGEYYDEDDDDDDDFDPDLKTELSLDKAYQLFDKKIGAKFQNFNEDSDEEDEFENEIQSFKNKGDFFFFKEYFFLVYFLFCHQLFVYIFSYHHSSSCSSWPDCLKKTHLAQKLFGIEFLKFSNRLYIYLSL